MKQPILSLVSLLCIFGAFPAEASQLVPIEAGKLQELAELVLVGTVKTVERDANNTIPKEITDYDIVTVDVGFVLKGTVTTKELKVRLATRGNRAFDPALTPQTTATFFLKTDKDDAYRTAYPSSVADFGLSYLDTKNSGTGNPPTTGDAKSPPLSKEAQAVLDGLNQKAADSVWQSAIDWIERPETRPPNTKDSGEATAFLSDSKKRLTNMGVRVSWNATTKRYEVAAEAKDDPIGRLVAKLSATTEWENGAFKPIDLPKDATAEQLAGQVFQTSSPIVANFKLIEARQVEIPTGLPKNYLAVLCQTGAVRKIMLLQFQPGGWWNRLYAVDEMEKREAPDAIDRLVSRLEAIPGHLWINGAYPIIHLPETASPEQVVEQVFKFTGFDRGHVKDFKISKSQPVTIDHGTYTAALTQTDLGLKIVLFTAGGAWSRVYDADEPAIDQPK